MRAPLVAILSVWALPAAGATVVARPEVTLTAFEGAVFLGSRPLPAHRLIPLADGSLLITAHGRAEIRLAGDAYLRLGENSGVRITGGSAELFAGSAVLTARGPATIGLDDAGVTGSGRLRLEANPPQMRVDQGAADVRVAASRFHLGAGESWGLSPGRLLRRPVDSADRLLDLWADERNSIIHSPWAAASGTPLLIANGALPGEIPSWLGWIPLFAYDPNPGRAYTGPPPSPASWYAAFPGFYGSADQPVPESGMPPRIFGPIPLHVPPAPGTVPVFGPRGYGRR